jgi:hypothetical protein
MVEITRQPNKSGSLRLVLMIAGAVAVGTGIFGIGFGSFWAPTALAFFAVDEVVQKFTLVIPFFPIFLIALGALLAVKSRQ